MTWAVQRPPLERRRESPETIPAQAGRRTAHAPGRGERLPDGIRDDLESRFGLDLDHVRVHREGAAPGMVGAADRAQTTGSDIAFARGEWDPSTRDGRWVLAHELAHVIQQSRRGPASDPGGSTDLEHSADEAADAVLTRSGPVQVSGAASTGIRQAKKKKPRPQAQIGDLKRYSKQGRSIWVGGVRGAEHEHLEAKINLQLVTRSPAGEASPYGKSAYRRSVTLTIPRDMALLKTRKDLALRDRIKAGTAGAGEVHVEQAVVRTIEARDEAIAARKAAGQPTADLESLTDEKIRWAAHLQQSELFDVGKKQVSPWAGMTDAEVQAATGIPADELAHPLGGTGIDEFAGPTTTVDIPDHSTPKTLTPAQAAAEAAAIEKSPEVRAYRARKAAEAAQAALQPPATIEPGAAAQAAFQPAATIEPGAAAQVDQPPAASVNAEEAAAPVKEPAVQVEQPPATPVKTEEAAAAPVKEQAVQVEQPPAAPVKTEEAAAAPVKEPAVQVEQPPAAPVKEAAVQVDQPPAALKSAGPTGVTPIESAAAPKAASGEIAAPAPTVQNTGRPAPEAEGSWKGAKVPESHSDPVGKASKVNAVLYAIRELRSRHDELVARGADSKAAWLEAGGRASATLIANLRGGGTAAAVNAANVYEQARKEGKDPLEAGATAVGTVAGGFATKQTAAGVAVEIVNNLAQLAGAPEGVQTATSGAVEALPSTAAVRVLTGGAQSFVAIGKGAYRAVKEHSLEKGAKEIDKVVTGFAKGDVGPLIQSPALWVGIAADVASGDSFEKARDKAAKLGSRDSQGNETWSSKAAGTVANLYLNLTHDPVERYDPVKEKQGKWERRLRRAFSW